MPISPQERQRIRRKPTVLEDVFKQIDYTITTKNESPTVGFSLSHKRFCDGETDYVSEALHNGHLGEKCHIGNSGRVTITPNTVMFSIKMRKSLNDSQLNFIRATYENKGWDVRFLAFKPAPPKHDDYNILSGYFEPKS